MIERNARDVCQACGKRPARYIVDVRAAVTILGQFCCGVCTNKILRKHPASQAVNLPQYEDRGWNDRRSK